MNTPADKNPALEGGVITAFYRFTIPSVLGLLAITSASIVDGIFIGNFVGAEALATVNLIIPFLNLLYGIALMLSIGGSVRAGKYIGERNPTAASAVFSKSLISVMAFALVTVSLGLLFDKAIYRILGATPDLYGGMAEYFRMLLPFFPFSAATIVLYYFIRMDGRPVLAAASLIAGATLNVALDVLFIGYLQWGLEGAALATGLSQIVQVLILLYYFSLSHRQLYFSTVQRQWAEVWQAAYNGISEFINETSAGVLTFIFNWLLIRSVGINGVAAFTVVNYMIFIGLMIAYGISDAMQVLFSQNFGARNPQRLRRFLLFAAINIFILGATIAVCLLLFQQQAARVFLTGEDSEALNLSLVYIGIIWPIFLVNGLNILISAYLTGIHQPFPSATIALSRTLVLPILVLGIIILWFPHIDVLAALPVAEWITFAMAILLLIRYRPQRVVKV